MAKTKTKETDVNVIDFIKAAEPEQRAKDGMLLMEIMKEITGLPPKMWGPTMVGFGSYHYKYDSGHEGDAMRVGFSPRKASISLYLMSLPDREESLQKLGKHKASKGCIYINKLSDVNIDVLKGMIKASFEEMNKKYPV